MGKKLTALWMAAAVTLMTCVTGMAAPFEPWSNVNGYWIAADGRSTIKGVVERGVSISKYQNMLGDINWGKVVKDKVSFVMVRLGYEDDKDPYFDANMRGAEKAGLKAGVLFYGKATSSDAARKEADYVLDVVKDYKVSYPIGYDLSGATMSGARISREQMTDMVTVFCDEIEDAGFRVAVFGDQEWLAKKIDVSKIPYDVWYNRFGLANSFLNRTLWRCTDSGHINGIPGNVCIEFSFEDYSESFEGDGWRTINDNLYYYDNYSMVRGTGIRIDGQFYFFDRDGIYRGFDE